MQNLDSFLTPIAQKPQNQKGEDLDIISTQDNASKLQVQQTEQKPKEQTKFNDLFNFDANNEQASAQAYETFAQNNGARTGFAYLDNKMANGSLSVMDGYLARHFLGIDLTAYFQVDMNLKNEFKNLKGYHDDFFSALETLELGEYLLDSSEDLNTFGNAASRALHKFSNGITHTSDANAKYMTAEDNYAYKMAKVIAGGRATDSARKEAKELISSGARDTRETRAKITTTQDMASVQAQVALEKMQAAGMPLPQDAVEKYKRIMAKNKAIQQDYSINLKEYNKKHSK